MRVAVLGSTGFVGRNLARELVARGHDCVGFGRTRARVLPREEQLDLAVSDALARFDERFDAAYLLAGAAVPGPGFDDASARANAAIARHALAWLANRSPGARTIVMSSAHVYGAEGDAEPLLETRPARPNGLYGESKLAVEGLAREAARELDVVIVRSFTPIGPGMPRGLLVPDLVAALTTGDGPVTMKGSDGVRDFLDVRDGARALADLAEAACPRGSVFNLCSGRGIAVSRLAAELARALRVERDVCFRARNEVPFVGSRAALTRATGFAPQYELAATVAWIAADEGRNRP
jgi:nucleoside-diphosphate-sugar epimerase